MTGFSFEFLPESQAFNCHLGVKPISSIGETEDPVDIIGTTIFVPDTVSIEQSRPRDPPLRTSRSPEEDSSIQTFLPFPWAEEVPRRVHLSLEIISLSASRLG